MFLVLPRCFSNILFTLSISTFATPFLSSISCSLSFSSIFSFVDAVRACRISSNLNLANLVSLSSSRCHFFMISSSLSSFSSKFSLILIGLVALICLTSSSASFSSLTLLSLKNDLSYGIWMCHLLMFGYSLLNFCIIHSFHKSSTSIYFMFFNLQ